MWRGEFKIKLLNSSFLSSQKNISSFPNEMKHFIRISYFLQSHVSTLSSFSLFLNHALGPLNKGGLHVKGEFKIKWLNSSFPSSQKKKNRHFLMKWSILLESLIPFNPMSPCYFPKKIKIKINHTLGPLNKGSSHVKGRV